MSGRRAEDLTLDDLARFLGQTDVGAESAQDEPTAFLDAAAVVVAFDPTSLRPRGSAADAPSDLPPGVLARSEQIEAGPLAGRWSLTLPERRSALRRLGRAGIVEELAATADRPDTVVQKVFERVVRGDPIGPEELRRMTRDEVAALSVVVDWLDGVVAPLPARKDVDAALQRAELFAPLHRLTEGGVVGRDRELDQLAQYLAEPGDALPPLFVHGLGGTGKSTLIAEFVLTRAADRDVPVAYLDLDRPLLRPKAPVTILLVALEQLAGQLALEPAEVEALTSEMSSDVQRVESGRELESANTSDARRLLARFAELVRPALGRRRLLLVLDTFEEAQHQGDDVTGLLVDFLLAARKTLPALRLVLAGRVLPTVFLRAAFPRLVHADSLADIEPAVCRPIDLGNLDRAAARTVLRDALERSRRPVLDADELDEVIDTVSANPMCLRLAARLLDDEGISEFRATRSQFLGVLRAEKIQAMLYGRILRQLHTGPAAALALPGLVVRRITPEVIRTVLAGPCGLVLGVGDEYAVFDQLRAEVALVEQDPDGSLRHRADVRREMLRDLTDQVGPAVVEQIHRAAVEFYRLDAEPVARAEEIYHRLQLGEAADLVEERWSDDAAPLLVGADVELPAAGRLWLATRLGKTVDPSLRELADLETWERQVALSAQRYLLGQRPDVAWELLSERPERSVRSPLFAVETDVLSALARLPDALLVACSGVRSAKRCGAWHLAVDLLLRMTVIQEGRGQLDREPAAGHPDETHGSAADDRCRIEEIGGARQLAADAVLTSSYTGDPVLRFRAGVTELRVLRRIRAKSRSDAGAGQDRDEGDDELATRRESLVAALESGLLAQLGTQPVLLREAAAELSGDSPELAALAMQTLGVEVADTDQAVALGHTIVNAVQATPGLGADADLQDAARQFEEAGLTAKEVRDWVSTTGKERHSAQLGQSLAGSLKGSQVLHDSREYFRAGVTSSLRINWVQSLQLAARQFDWPAVSELAAEYVDALCAAPTEVSTLQARQFLRILREHRRYEDLLHVADALLVIDADDVAVRRAVAQGLVDRERPAASRLIFQSILDKSDVSPQERAEARGGIGRCAKEMFLLARTEPTRRARLQEAYDAYRNAYDEDPGRLYYHGINVVALLARADRDAIPLHAADGRPLDTYAEARAVARQVLAVVEGSADPDIWELTTMCEANIALERYNVAVEVARHLVEAQQPGAFELASMLRQLSRIWELDTTTTPGDQLLPLLRAALLQCEGGGVVLGAFDLRAERFDAAFRGSLAAAFTGTAFRSLDWYRTGLLRCRAVARIESSTGRVVGTGVLADLGASTALTPRPVVVTNAHIVPDALPPDEAVVVFHGLDADTDARRAFRVRRVVWTGSSSPPGLDITLLELDGRPVEVPPVPVSLRDPDRPTPGLPASRIYVVGHQAGPEPRFVLHDNTLLDFDERVLHYRSASERAGSGNPVFDAQWRLIGLHHAAGPDLPRLNDHGGSYAANEAVRLAAVDRARRLQP